MLRRHLPAYAALRRRNGSKFDNRYWQIVEVLIGSFDVCFQS